MKETSLATGFVLQNSALGKTDGEDSNGGGRSDFKTMQIHESLQLS